MKKYIKEPETCENCLSQELMTFGQAEINGVKTMGWACNNCGHFHIYKPKKHGPECDCPKCNNFEP